MDLLTPEQRARLDDLHRRDRWMALAMVVAFFVAIYAGAKTAWWCMDAGWSDSAMGGMSIVVWLAVFLTVQEIARWLIKPSSQW